MSRRTIAMTVLSEGIGGAEAVVRQIARHIDKSKYDCLILTNDEIQGYYRDTGGRTVSLGSFHRWAGLPVLNRLASRIEASRPALVLARLREKADLLSDVVHRYHVELLHSHLLEDFYMVSQLAPGTVKRVMTIHGGLGLDVALPCFWDRDEMLAALGQADFLTSACQYFLKLLGDNGVNTQGRCALVANGIDGEVVPDAELPDASGRDNVLRMVFLGGDRYAKGGDLLARALGLVVRENGLRNVHLTVLRNVHHSSEMYRYLSTEGLLELVDLAGYAGNTSHLDYIRRSDLFVLPSRSEGIANTLMEAIGLGKAILATDVGGTGEVVSHGINGYLCQPAPESIAAGIVYFLKNPAKLTEFGRRNAELRPRFLWPGIVAKYEDLYEKLLTGQYVWSA
ncbi:MAG: glycosyltransferase family 4 protein [Planctomycetes bacterium]|nr:glycosyltransferase family 4 protein [Planctomycetota bacterium]